MALLDFLKKKKGAEKAQTKAAPAGPEEAKAPWREKKERGFKEKNDASERAFKILLSPQVTEKTSDLNARGVYVFRVAPDANKSEVKKAVWELYGIRARKVNVVKIPAKARFSRGKKGLRPGYLKALVFLKPGETIEVA